MLKRALLLTAIAGIPACAIDHCADHNADQFSCEGNRVVGCMRTFTGVRSFEGDCGDQVCLNPEPGLAFCAIQSEMDPRCPPPVPSSSPQRIQICCAGHELECLEGYVTFDQDCGAGLCYTPPPGPAGSLVESPTCVFTASADPRCTEATNAMATSDPRRTSVCLTTEVLLCLDDRVWGTVACGPQGCDAEHDGCR